VRNPGNRLRSSLGMARSHPVADGSLLRLIGKCLHVGVLDGEALSEPELDTAQGSVLSPLLGNVYGRLFGRKGTVAFGLP
jgi:hypothetical protein